MKPLTDEDIHDLYKSAPFTTDTFKYARAIEAAVNAKWEHEVAMQKVSQFAQEQEAKPTCKECAKWRKEQADNHEWIEGVKRGKEIVAAMAAKLQHVTDGTQCWCNPELDYVDPITGAEVWVHKEPQ
jgi:hypothetical protein